MFCHNNHNTQIVGHWSLWQSNVQPFQHFNWPPINWTTYSKGCTCWKEGVWCKKAFKGLHSWQNITFADFFDGNYFSQHNFISRQRTDVPELEELEDSGPVQILLGKHLLTRGASQQEANLKLPRILLATANLSYDCSLTMMWIYFMYFPNSTATLFWTLWMMNKTDKCNYLSSKSNKWNCTATRKLIDTKIDKCIS